MQRSSVVIMGGAQHSAGKLSWCREDIRLDEGNCMDRLFFVLGSLGALFGVTAGAFGAHAMRARITPDMLAIFETAVRYQLVHSLALLAVAWAVIRWPGRSTVAAGWLFVAGIVLFSGSLYALALSGARSLGWITPFGGLAFIVGWSCLAWSAWRSFPKPT
jgi:uncharacterized membrane protein YgdD (TMEM256/DUF423 family)